MRSQKKQNMLKVLLRLANPDFYIGKLYNNTPMRKPSEKEKKHHNIAKKSLEDMQKEYKNKNIQSKKLINSLKASMEQNKNDFEKGLIWIEDLSNFSKDERSIIKEYFDENGRFKEGWMPYEAVEVQLYKKKDSSISTLNNQRSRFYDDAFLKELIQKRTLNIKIPASNLIRLYDNKPTWRKVFDFVYECKDLSGNIYQDPLHEFMLSTYTQKHNPKGFIFYSIHQEIQSNRINDLIVKGMKEGNMTTEEIFALKWMVKSISESLKIIDKEVKIKSNKRHGSIPEKKSANGLLQTSQDKSHDTFDLFCRG